MILVVYDKNCADGTMSAGIIEKKYNNNPAMDVVLFPYRHSKGDEINPDFEEHLSAQCDVICVDTAPSLAEMDWFLSPQDPENGDGLKPRIRSLAVWDHHSGTAERLDGYKPPQIEGFKTPPLEIKIDVDAPSAALLVWQTVMGEEAVPEIVRFVGNMEPKNKGDNTPRLTTTNQFAAAAYIDSLSKDTQANIVAMYKELSVMTLSTLAEKGRVLLTDQFNNLELMRSKMQYTELEILPGRRICFPIFCVDPALIGRIIDPEMIEQGRQSISGVAAMWRVRDQSGKIDVSIRTDGDHPNARAVVEHLKSVIPGTYGSGHEDAAVITFDSLRDFAQAVPLFDKDEAVKRLYGREAAVSLQPVVE